MCSCLFWAVGLLLCAGVWGAYDQPERVFAFAGGDVILPCSFKVSESDDFPTVEWSKKDLKPKILFLFRDFRESPEMKHPDFEYRTSFIVRGVKDGNVSLRMSDVKLSDAGEYQCLRLRNTVPEVSTVELVVAAVSEPKLFVAPSDSNNVILECEAICWLPEPQMTILDHRGNNITTKEAKREEADGCYTIRQRVTLQSPTSRVICRVELPQFNQTRTTEIFIPAFCALSKPLIIGISIGGTALLFLFVIGFYFLWKRHRKHVEAKPVVARTESNENSTSENGFLLGPNGKGDECDGTGIIRELKRKLSDCKAELLKKDKTIRQLESTSESQHNCTVCQQNQPTMVQSSSRSKAAVPKSPCQLSGLSLETENPKPMDPIDRHPSDIPFQKKAVHRQCSHPPAIMTTQRNRHKNNSLTLSEAASTRPHKSSTSSADVEPPCSLRSQSDPSPGESLRGRNTSTQRRPSLGRPLAPNNRYAALVNAKQQ